MMTNNPMAAALARIDRVLATLAELIAENDARLRGTPQGGN